jgi:hypothetical protein
MNLSFNLCFKQIVVHLVLMSLCMVASAKTTYRYLFVPLSQEQEVNEKTDGHVYTHISTHTYLYIYIYIYAHIYIHIYVDICIYAYKTTYRHFFVKLSQEQEVYLRILVYI